ncbi:MAG TPA: hypothetical protein VLJ39_09175 [Tepidisphaeraceae bacterium]|nr:hypothetical protein [Tepidisphaeraceae bacterium]
MQRSWVLGGVGGLLLASVLWARPGTVRTRDGQTITGDITEQREQVVVVNKGIQTTVARDEIRSVTYADSIEQEYRRRFTKLTAYDVPGRLELAQWLLENKAYDFSLEVLQDARRIQPRNEEVAQLTRTVVRQSELDHNEARKHAPVQLAAADSGPGAAAPATGAAPHTGGGRLLDADEINFIRQSEWQEGQQVRATFRDDVRRKYIARSGVDAATFNRLPPSQQAWAIVKNGTDEMRKDVILSDPPAMLGFRRVQQSLLSTGCANCHTGEKAQGNFSLHFPADSEAATYTNFVILQKYKFSGKDRTHAMIERERPDDSLLVQFSLPPDVGNPAHPKAQNYKGAVRTRNDPRLKAAVDWISSLTPIVPDYSQIDLTAKAPPAGPAQPAPARRPPTTRPAPAVR